ncbi:LOW QUALITY PROTEIN: hypothetical protein CFOL_v3_04167, partial [Cephalotus follicularis]
IQQQTEILDSIQINEIEEPVINLHNETIEDVVTTLIYNITKYFIEDPTCSTDKTADQLSNLKCRKLQDFRWYKDTFMTKILIREMLINHKEKFITGLPTLFSEKIKSKYHEQYNGIVTYDTLIYGDIVSIITKTGLEIIPCLHLACPSGFKIIETDASDIGNGGILKQIIGNQKQLVQFTSGSWNLTQSN